MDQEHIQKVLAGDKNAFRYFVKVYQAMCYSIAISMVKQEADAKDVVQNSFIRAFKSLRAYRHDAKFSSWLYKIVVNESLRHLKSSKQRDRESSLEEEHYGQNSTLNTAISDLNSKDKLKAINEALKRMKPKEALILNLFYMHELSIIEIMESTGFSKANIKVLLHRARKSFAQLYIQDKRN